jgi:hypothetical protein
MTSNLEKLSAALRNVASNEKDAAERLVAKIKSDPQIQDELMRNGEARFKDDLGRDFVVRRKTASVTSEPVTR